MSSEPLTTEWMRKALAKVPREPSMPKWVHQLVWRTFRREDGAITACRRRAGFGFVGKLWQLYLHVWRCRHPGEPLN